MYKEEYARSSFWPSGKNPTHPHTLTTIVFLGRGDKRGRQCDPVNLLQLLDAAAFVWGQSRLTITSRHGSYCQSVQATLTYQGLQLRVTVLHNSRVMFSRATKHLPFGHRPPALPRLALAPESPCLAHIVRHKPRVSQGSLDWWRGRWGVQAAQTAETPGGADASYYGPTWKTAYTFINTATALLLSLCPNIQTVYSDKGAPEHSPLNDYLLAFDYGLIPRLTL